jgi:hypothetical protein
VGDGFAGGRVREGWVWGVCGGRGGEEEEDSRKGAVFVCGERSVGRLWDALRCVVCWIGKMGMEKRGMERMVERGGRRGEEEEEMEMEMEM